MVTIPITKLQQNLEPNPMTQQEFGIVKKAFAVFADYNEHTDSSRLTKDWLPIALRSMKLIPTEEQIERFTELYFGPKGIDEETFIKITEECWLEESAIENALWDSFSVFDPFHSGRLTPEVMRDILTKYGEPLPEEDVELIMKKSVNKDGLVVYSTLIAQWKKFNIFPPPKIKKGKSDENGGNKKKKNKKK